jgi:hypothetical protein
MQGQSHFQGSGGECLTLDYTLQTEKTSARACRVKNGNGKSRVPTSRDSAIFLSAIVGAESVLCTEPFGGNRDAH